MCQRTLYSMHEEADPGMTFHLHSVTNQANQWCFGWAFGCMGNMSSDIKVAFVFYLVHWCYFCKLY